MLFANLDGDLGAIGKKLDSMGLTGNDMLKIAGLDFNFSGVDYYRELENTSITDPLIRAVAENMKAQSLIADSHNYWLYQPYLVARWIPVWTTNDELLGKNMIRAKKYFFDYPASNKSYQRGTAGSESDNLRWRTDVHHLSIDPYVLREAPNLWRRVADGAYSGAGKTLNVVQEGFVTDESGKPLEEVVVTDFDTYTRGSLEYNTASTDSAGHYQLTTGRNHLLRFEAIFDRQFRERFVTAGSETAGRMVIRRKK
ncbi:MAG: carboxypeptidase-like regulatory domain-containing protein [Bacteroidota bacterium]